LAATNNLAVVYLCCVVDRTRRREFDHIGQSGLVSSSAMYMYMWYSGLNFSNVWGVSLDLEFCLITDWILFCSGPGRVLVMVGEVSSWASHFIHPSLSPSLS
jgi:hypothetical protein